MRFEYFMTSFQISLTRHNGCHRPALDNLELLYQFHLSLSYLILSLAKYVRCQKLWHPRPSVENETENYNFKSRFSMKKILWISFHVWNTKPLIRRHRHHWPWKITQYRANARSASFLDLPYSWSQNKAMKTSIFNRCLSFLYNVLYKSNTVGSNDFNRAYRLCPSALIGVWFPPTIWRS